MILNTGSRTDISASPILIGEVTEDDVVKLAEQKSWKNRQLDIFTLP